MPRGLAPSPTRPVRRLRGRIVAAVLSASVAAGCATAGTPEVTNGDPGLEAGREIYIRQCVSCHGADGGGGRGPALNDGRVLENFPDESDQIAIVADGKSSMPAFSGRLSADEIADVVAYTREVLTVAGSDQES